MSVRSVQFVDLESVVEAYTNMKVPAFTIWHDKQYLFKWVGADMVEGEQFLTGILEKLSDSAAIYTLKVYEDPEGKINEKTLCDGSFNFRFQAVPVYSTPGTPVMNGNRQLNDTLAGIQKQLDELKNGGTVGDTGGALGFIGEILMHPAIEPLVPMLADKLVNLVFPSTPQPPPQQRVAQTARIAGIDPEARKRIDQALAILDENVDDLPAIMEKLADVACRKPIQFKSYLNMFMRF